MTDTLRRGTALLPKDGAVYRGEIRIHGHPYIAVITREGDGVRLSIHDAPLTEADLAARAADRLEHEAFLDRLTRAVAG